jgi:hypothetical protein
MESEHRAASSLRPGSPQAALSDKAAVRTTMKNDLTTETQRRRILDGGYGSSMDHHTSTITHFFSVSFYEKACQGEFALANLPLFRSSCIALLLFALVMGSFDPGAW